MVVALAIEAFCPLIAIFDEMFVAETVVAAFFVSYYILLLVEGYLASNGLVFTIAEDAEEFPGFCWR